MRVLLADDNEAILKEVAELLSGHCEVVGAVLNGDLLVKEATVLDPDLIVVDISMPVMSGLEAVQELKKSASRARVVFLSVFQQRCYIDACFSAGANAFVSKSRVSSDLVRALDDVMAGRTFISEQ